MGSFRLQRLVHWLEIGQGKKGILVIGLLAFIGLFTWYHCYKRFSGPSSEEVIEFALIGKNLSEGKGFTSPVIYPQTLAFLENRPEGYKFSQEKPLPDLYHAPLYPLVLAGALKILPVNLRQAVWADPVSEVGLPYPAFNGDYFLMTVNVFFFWLSCLMAYCVGRFIFSAWVGIIAMLGVLFSVGLWDSVLALSGLSLLLFLVLVLFQLWCVLERWRLQDPLLQAAGSRALLLSLAIGLAGGLLFLTEYTAGLIFIVFCGYLIVRFRGTLLVKLSVPALFGFLFLVSPWCWRNITWTGNPLALASHNLALKVGDPTAEPDTFRKSFQGEGPEINLRKIGNKGLKGLEINLKERLWSGGAYVFTAFLLVGCLYRFRNRLANNMRWGAVLALFSVMVLQPFFSSGQSERLPALYLAPLIIIFGAGFFFIMLESTGRRTRLERISWITLLLLFQALPMIHNLMEPKRAPFTYPPYVPSLLARTRTHLTDHFFSGYAIMSDIPAGLAWYSQQPVWAQPGEYAEFVEVLLRQEVGALFLSPKVLDRPYFSQLLRADLDSGGEYLKNRYWGAIYGSLQQQKVPRYFPLSRVQQISTNMYVLLNPLAWRGE